MYKIRYANSTGTIVTTTISNARDLKKITKGEAINTTITTKISDNMPVKLHNTIADHNTDVRNRMKQVMALKDPLPTFEEWMTNKYQMMDTVKLEETLVEMQNEEEAISNSIAKIENELYARKNPELYNR